MARQQNNKGQRPEARGGRGANRKGPERQREAAGRQRPGGRSQAHPGKGGQRSGGATRPARAAQPAHAPAGSYLEGRRAAIEALRTGYPVKRALVAESSSKDVVLTQIIEALRSVNAPVSYVAREQLDAISSHGAHQGIVLEVGSYPYADLSDIISRAGDGPALVLVLDHVTDAGNFGAIVRSAEVVGAAGVVIANKRAAEVTVATYKTSAGAVMHLPIAQVPNIARALEDLKEAGFWACGASEHAEQVCWDAPLEGRVALVMGSEGEGISRLVLQTCDFLTKLPQRGETESLNVAQAATALSFEWMRRNRAVLVDGAGE